MPREEQSQMAKTATRKVKHLLHSTLFPQYPCDQTLICGGLSISQKKVLAIPNTTRWTLPTSALAKPSTGSPASCRAGRVGDGGGICLSGRE